MSVVSQKKIVGVYQIGETYLGPLRTTLAFVVASTKDCPSIITLRGAKANVEPIDIVERTDENFMLMFVEF